MDSTDVTEFVRCTFDGNHTTLGGAIYASRGSVVCRDCVFTNNSACFGYSIDSGEGAELTLINCLFAGNRSLAGACTGNGWDLEVDSGTMINCTVDDTHLLDSSVLFGGVVRNSILRGPSIGVSEDISYSNIQAYAGGGVGNIDRDPRFVDAAGGDYRLLPDSPCIDRGTSEMAPDHDLDGVGRPVDIPGRGFDGPGEGFDMGAYEYVLPREDLNKDGKVDVLDLWLFQKQWHK